MPVIVDVTFCSTYHISLVTYLPQYLVLFRFYKHHDRSPCFPFTLQHPLGATGRTKPRLLANGMRWPTICAELIREEKAY